MYRFKDLVIDFNELRNQIIGVDSRLDTPFGSRLMLYADYTASGRGLKFIEEYLVHVQAHYANTHTEDDSSGRMTTQLLHDAERLIKRAVNAGPDGCVVACGSGATAAIDRIQQLVGIKYPPATQRNVRDLMTRCLGQDSTEVFDQFSRLQQPVVFVGPYEHHSNEISWREGLATVVEVSLDNDGGVNLTHLEQLLREKQYQGRLRIGSFSAASNVTGMKTDVEAIAVLLHKYDALAFFDYAASAPYVDIDMNPVSSVSGNASLDAVFISPHKFLGGPGSSGILIFNRYLYPSALPPSVAGGGTVDYVGPKDHDFIDDIEGRESAGTPAILQTIKAALVFELKQFIGTKKIQQREHKILERVFSRWSVNPNIEILGNADPAQRINIVSLNIKCGERYLHPRFVTRLLNDLFGIQSRAGCSCAGPYGHLLLGIGEELAEEYRDVIAQGYQGYKPGWVRVSFHYVFDDLDVNYLVEGMEFVAEHGERFLPLYNFDQQSGLWTHRKFQERSVQLSLADAMQSMQSQPGMASRHSDFLEVQSQSRADHYQDNLVYAQSLAAQLAMGSASIELQEDQPGDSGLIPQHIPKVQFFELGGEPLRPGGSSQI